VGHGLAESEKLTKNRDGFSPEIVFSFVTCRAGQLAEYDGKHFHTTELCNKVGVVCCMSEWALICTDIGWLCRYPGVRTVNRCVVTRSVR